MPEGNETHRWAELHAGMFAGRKVFVDSPQGRFTDAGLLDGRVLVGVLAVGKHMGYDFGVIKRERRILHVHMGLYGDFIGRRAANAGAARRPASAHMEQGAVAGTAWADGLLGVV